MNNKMKNTKTKLSKWHIAIIIIGIIFNGIGIMHSNLWFDEAYSVGIASHNWIDIWNIGGHDVHPILDTKFNKCDIWWKYNIV